VLIVPFLAGDLFAIWRQTDLAAEREKNRLRRLLSMTTPEEDDLPPPTDEELAETAMVSSMNPEVRARTRAQEGGSDPTLRVCTASPTHISFLRGSCGPQERAEYDKNKREQVVYTMLQDKYGLDEDQIYSEEDKRRLQNGAYHTSALRPAPGCLSSSFLIHPFHTSLPPLSLSRPPALPAATLLNKMNAQPGLFPDPIYMYIVGVIAVLCYFLFRRYR